MSRWLFVGLCGLGAHGFDAPEARAEENPALACLEQCKDQTEQCINAAGEDVEKQKDCASDALACIQSCEGGPSF